MANIAFAPEWYRNLANVYSNVDDFTNEINTTTDYTLTVTDSGSATIGAEANGILTIVPSDGTVADNDEAYLGQVNNTFVLAAGKNVNAVFRLQYAEAATNAANIAFGLTNSVAADLLVDNGGGLRATGTTMAIYKVDGETLWRCVSRNGSNVTISQSDTTAGGAAYIMAEIEVSEVTTTHATVLFSINGNYLKDSTTGQVIRHRIAFASAAALTPFVAIKNGSTTMETLKVDVMGALQPR